ncbi:hypothetical protein, partial [Aeromonas caviae]|uniref:hypothetical protein n=1 Tax=Aeromonas caviae TaxID=648 RepID=UPI001BD12ACD
IKKPPNREAFLYVPFGHPSQIAVLQCHTFLLLRYLPFLSRMLSGRRFSIKGIRAKLWIGKDNHAFEGEEHAD